MKNALMVVLTAIGIWSLAQLFKIDGALVEFVILGRIPGTNLQLNLFAISAFAFFVGFVLFGWARTLMTQLMEFKLEDARNSELVTLENQAANAKLAHVKVVSRQLDVEELDPLST